MQTVYIKFTSPEHRARGFYELATRSRLASLPGEIYQIPLSAIPLLENENIGFRRAMNAEVSAAHDQV